MCVRVCACALALVLSNYEVLLPCVSILFTCLHYSSLGFKLKDAGQEVKMLDVMVNMVITYTSLALLSRPFPLLN